MGKTLDKLSKQGKAFVASVGLLGMIGCQNLPPQGQAFIRDMGYNAIQTGISEGIRGELNPSAYPNNVQQNVYVQEQNGQTNQINQQQSIDLQKLVNYKSATPVYDIPGAETIFNQKIGYVTFVTCNYIKDFGNDGVFDFPQDFVGVGERFFSDKGVMLYVGINHLKDRDYKDKIGFKFFDSNSNKLAQDEFTGSSFSINFTPGKLKPGQYRAVFDFEGEILGERDFLIY